MKRLLIHICCAPDASLGFERLSQEWETEGLFVNSNIHPPEEYARRLGALVVLSEKTGIRFKEGCYDPDAWFARARGLEKEPEKGLRCEMCIRERMRETARQARDGGFDAFAAVLTVSPRKDAAMINRLGLEAGKEFGIEYLPTDLKKRDGFKRSVELSKKYGIYRQDYCGCKYSRNRSKNAAGSADQGSRAHNPKNTRDPT